MILHQIYHGCQWLIQQSTLKQKKQKSLVGDVNCVFKWGGGCIDESSARLITWQSACCHLPMTKNKLQPHFVPSSSARKNCWMPTYLTNDLRWLIAQLDINSTINLLICFLILKARLPPATQQNACLLEFFRCCRVWKKHDNQPHHQICNNVLILSWLMIGSLAQ